MELVYQHFNGMLTIYLIIVGATPILGANLDSFIPQFEEQGTFFSFVK